MSNSRNVAVGGSDETKPHLRQKRMPAYREERWLKWIFVLPALIIIVSLMFYPLVKAVMSSMYTYMFGRATSFVGLSNWANAFSDVDFIHSIKITLLYSVIAIVIEMAVAIFLAVIFSDLEGHLSKRWIGLSRAIIIFPFVIMPTVTGIMWRLIFLPKYGLTNYLLSLVGGPQINWLGSDAGSLAAVIIMDIWMWVPFIFVIILAGLQSLSREPFEAAVVDGASGWQTFRHITLPLLKPALLVAVSLRTIDALRIFDQVYAMTKGGPGNSTMFISLQLSNTAFSNMDFGTASAQLFIVLVIMLVIIGLYYAVGKVRFDA